MKLIVSGSRDIQDRKLVEQHLSEYMDSHIVSSIIEGECRGPDIFARDYAEKNGIPVIKVPAEWEKYGMRAGYIRNKKMAEMGDALLAFQKNKSSGTQNMIKIMKKMNKDVEIIMVI